MTPEFFLTSMIVILLPGTGVLYTLAFGLGQGLRASVFAAFGCTLGIVPHITAGAVGLAALLHASAVAFQFVKYIGVAYLMFMAWSVFRETGPLRVSARKSRLGERKIVTDGFLLNILNPKLSIFFLAFLPQFAEPSRGPISLQLLLLGGVFIIATILVFGGIALLAGTLGPWLNRSEKTQRVMNKLAGTIFVGLALKLARAEQ
ncbi:MAG: LysE family translocator [Desulfuromonadales bacterium]|nr:LysE family translocator [Desulfuromonadales bacterium]